MITYDQLKEKPKQFLAATGLKVEEFERILPVFKEKLAATTSARAYQKEARLGNGEPGLVRKRNCVQMKTSCCSY